MMWPLSFDSTSAHSHHLTPSTFRLPPRPTADTMASYASYLTRGVADAGITDYQGKRFLVRRARAVSSLSQDPSLTPPLGPPNLAPARHAYSPILFSRSPAHACRQIGGNW